MQKQFFPITSLQFWKAYFIQCRPYLFFVSGVAGLAGIAAYKDLAPNTGYFLLAFIPFFLGYGLGQALTDTWQLDTDRLSAPYRPMSKGLIGPNAVRWVSFTGLTLLALSLIFLNLWNLLFGFLTIAGLATYSHFKKKYWFAGPFYNALIVAYLPVMGILCASGEGLLDLHFSEFQFLVLLSFFSYSNFVLMGYLKDISADKATGYQTFPVVFGWDATTWVGDIFVLLSMFFAYQIVDGMAGMVIFTIAGLLAISGQLSAHFITEKTEANSRFAIEATVRSFILWHAAAIVSFKPHWIVYMVLFYILFEIALFARPEKGQI